MQVIMNGMQEALVQVNPNYQPAYFDVNTISVSNNVKTTKSLTLQQIMAEQYGIDEQSNPREVLIEINQLMKEHDLNNSSFRFSDLPYLEEVLTNPTTENISKAKEVYAKALKKIEDMLANHRP